jgi:hypothetical protein
MLRQHFGEDNFYTVPDEDQGDYGIEFFTIQGTIFQCYFPNPQYEMAKYKKEVQKKINDDLKKLKSYEKEIFSMLDGTTINRWVLLTPENRSKNLITYCNKKKNELLKEGIKFIDKENFRVKIETADSYESAKLYALAVQGASINIPLDPISEEEKEAWIVGHSGFSENILRKSNILMGENSIKFQKRVIENYIQTDKFLSIMRSNHPDLLDLIEDTARALLEDSKNNALFEDTLDQNFVKSLQSNNKSTFEKYAKHLSDSNNSLLAFGYLSKWVAECHLDFIYEDEKKD